MGKCGRSSYSYYAPGSCTPVVQHNSASSYSNSLWAECEKTGRIAIVSITVRTLSVGTDPRRAEIKWLPTWSEVRKICEQHLRRNKMRCSGNMDLDLPFNSCTALIYTKTETPFHQSEKVHALNHCDANFSTKGLFSETTNTQKTYASDCLWPR
jgi:hypothetical protein